MTSPAFEEAQSIPVDFTGEGADRSPELHWSGAPEQTRSFVLICDDPDAPGKKPFVHWIVYQIDPKATMISEGIPNAEKMDIPVRLIQGVNSFGEIGYRGPMPPKGHGWHRYFFKLYALDCELNVQAGASREELLEKMEGHILAESRLMGKYRREFGQSAA